MAEGVPNNLDPGSDEEDIGTDNGNKAKVSKKVDMIELDNDAYDIVDITEDNPLKDKINNRKQYKPRPKEAHSKPQQSKQVPNI